MQNLSDITVIREILGRHGFTFSKSLGQNFLINPSVCPRMAEACGAESETGVLEIGPGLGVLTVQLAKRAKKVVAVELDKRLLPVLQETLSESENVTVINGDALKLDLKQLLKEQFGGMPVSVCANLPYYITSPVIMKLLEDRLPVENITVMVQKEAADRLCAQVGTREAGAVTVAVNYYAEAKQLFHVAAGSFLPQPKVDSAVLRLDIRQQPPVNVLNERFFFRMVKSAFAQRRKTALNAISAGMSLPKEQVQTALQTCGLPPAVRGEKLTMQQLGVLANTLYLQQEREGIK